MTTPYRTADALGPLVREHVWRGGSGQVVIGLFFLVLGLFLVWFWGWPPRDWVSIAGVGGCGLFAGLAWLAAWQDRGMRIALHERGVVQHQASRTRSILFEDLESIRSRWENVDGMPSQSHTLRAASGEKIDFTHGVEKVNELVAFVRSKVEPRLLAQALEAVGAGRAVSFGRVDATSQALRTQDIDVPWEEAHLALQRGFLRIGQTEMKVGDVENLFVLLALARALGFPPETEAG